MMGPIKQTNREMELKIKLLNTIEKMFAFLDWKVALVFCIVVDRRVFCHLYCFINPTNTNI